RSWASTVRGQNSAFTKACASYSPIPRSGRAMPSADEPTPMRSIHWRTLRRWRDCSTRKGLPHDHDGHDEQLFLPSRGVGGDLLRAQSAARVAGLDSRSLLDEAPEQPGDAVGGVFRRRAGDERRLFVARQGGAHTESDLFVRGPPPVEPP